jgi:hypothetical protein
MPKFNRQEFIDACIAVIVLIIGLFEYECGGREGQ